jgi:hypothetical protein
MTHVLIDYMAADEVVADVAQAAELFDRCVNNIVSDEGYGQTVWIGRADSGYDASSRTLNVKVLDLRVDIDVEVGRAALTWQPDGSVGVEVEPGPPLQIMHSVDAATIVVPGTRARVTADTARRAVLEYVVTDERPTCVAWTVPQG